MKPFKQRRNGFSLVEFTVACTMTAFLAVMLSATWQLLMPTTSKIIASGQIFQEMDIAVSSISRDIGGSLPDNGYADEKKKGRLLGVRKGSGHVLQLWFDGGNNADTPPTTWSPKNDDIIIEYSADKVVVDTNDDYKDKYFLVRKHTVYDNSTSSSFTVANLGRPPTTPTADDDPPPAMTITPCSLNGVAGLQIELTFTYHFPQENKHRDYVREDSGDPTKYYRYRPLSRKCTLWVTQLRPLPPP